jgi:hypothetical protein
VRECVRAFGGRVGATQDGVTGVIGSFFTVVEMAKIITILLANSNPRNISLLRDRLGGG